MKHLAERLRRFVTRGPRGMVILIVLVMLAAVSMILAGQLGVGVHQNSVGLRAAEEVQARALADGCLSMMFKLADTWVHSPPADPPMSNADCSPTVPCRKDFDLLLDPNGTPWDGDDFLPQIASLPIAYIPSSESTPAGERRAMHQWGYIARNGGACLVRFDDNSDDGAFSTASLPLGATTAAVEGLGIDVNNRDRDRSIIISAIGIYPVLGGSNSTNAYERAHARVTLRKVFAPSVPQDIDPAVFAGGAVSLGNNATICSPGGGLSGNTVSVGGGSTCMCGPVEANSTPSVPASPATCTSCAQSCYPSSSNTPQNNGYTIKAPAFKSGMFANEGWGKPFAQYPNLGAPPRGGPDFRSNGEAFIRGTTPTPYSTTYTAPIPANNIGDVNYCSISFRRDPADTTKGEVWVWDPWDVNPAVTWAAYGATGTFTATSCLIETSDPFPSPCTVTARDGLFKPTALTCAAGQSACWKPQAYIISSSTGWAAGGVVGSVQDGSYNPSSAVPLAFTSPFGTAKTWGGSGAAQLCGKALGFSPARINACANCNGANPSLAMHGGHWHVEDQMGNDTFPVPAFILVQDSGSPMAKFEGGVGLSGSLSPFWATWIMSGDVDVETGPDQSFCAAKMPCDAITTNARASTLVIAAAREAEITGAGALRDDGFVMKTPGEVDWNNNGSVYGVMAVGSVQFANQLGLVGGLRGYADNTAGIGGSVSGGGGCSNANIQFGNSGVVVGDVYSTRDIDFSNTPAFKGRLVAFGNICGGNSMQIDGFLAAGGNLNFGNNFTIRPDPTLYGDGQYVMGNPLVTQHMELPW